MIEVESVVPWSATERSQDPDRVTGEIDVLAGDLRRTVRFYSRVFGLPLARRDYGASRAIIPVTSAARLVIHDAQAPVRRSARCLRRWGFVVANLDLVRAKVWELGVKVARDSGAPDQIYRWSNGRSLYIETPDGHEIELVELGSRHLETSPARVAAAS